MKKVNEIWVIGDKKVNSLLSLISKARAMADKSNGRVRVILLYPYDPDSCIYAGADEVCIINGLKDVADDAAVANALADMIGKAMPNTVLFQATIRSRGIAPAIAALLETGLTADCTDLSMDEDGLLLQIRPAFGNSIIAEIVCKEHRPQMATVRPGVFANPILDKSRSGAIKHISIEASSKINRIRFEETEGTDILSEAKIIIAGGAGIGSKEGFDYLHDIAKRIGGAVGASRAAVDAGYAPYSCQIGQTGVIVRPRLFIAVGISGAVQHIAGMSNSDYIIAVNTDRKAPIFNYADYGIVADWKKVVNQWITNLDNREEIANEL